MQQAKLLIFNKTSRVKTAMALPTCSRLQVDQNYRKIVQKKSDALANLY